MSTEITVGDWVRLTGAFWEENYVHTGLKAGSLVQVTEIEDGLIWVGDAGIVGRGGKLYDINEPSTYGFFSAEYVGPCKFKVGDRVIAGDVPGTVMRVESPTVYEVRFDDEEPNVHYMEGDYLEPYIVAEEPLRDWERELLEEVAEDSAFAGNVRRILEGIGDTIIEKNIAYGNSALNPVNVFSKADRTEQIRVRIDDKLNRVRTGHEYPGDDTVLDLIGYLVLYKMAGESE